MSFFYKPYDLFKKNKRSLRTKSKAQANSRIYVEKSLCRKRTFFFTFLPGAMTVEAACVIPIFIFAMVCLLSLFYMFGTTCRIYSILAKIAHHTSIYGYDEQMSTSYVTGVMALHLMQGGSFSSITGGTAGINIYGTAYDQNTGEITLSARYRLKPIMGVPGMGINAKTLVKTRAYIGGKMMSEETVSQETGGTKIYVAENGVVFHQDRECAYIDITLNPINIENIELQRNAQGGKYYPCELCAGAGGSGIRYITDTGNRYHKDTECSGIRRTVYEMETGEKCPLPACSKCGG